MEDNNTSPRVMTFGQVTAVIGIMVSILLGAVALLNDNMNVKTEALKESLNANTSALQSSLTASLEKQDAHLAFMREQAVLEHRRLEKSLDETSDRLGASLSRVDETLRRIEQKL